MREPIWTTEDEYCAECHTTDLGNMKWQDEGGEYICDYCTGQMMIKNLELTGELGLTAIVKIN